MEEETGKDGLAVIDQKTVQLMLADPVKFIEQLSRLTLRSYQVEVARTIVDSVILKRGLSLVVLFPRQSGKNELQAQVETFLLAYCQHDEAEIVKVSPTWRPQSINAMRRLERVLKRNPLTFKEWRKEAGYIYRIGTARIFFLSGAPDSNIVGATASLLLEVDEAQDLEAEKYDKDIAPMAASTNATRVFWGTAWTSQTLLARELRSAREAEREDGQRRVFVVDAERVAAEVPAYGKFVAAQVARLGRTHPMVRTQFFSEEIDSEGGMFPAARRQRMQGDHPALDKPTPGRIYALLLDVAGEDEAAEQGGDPANWALHSPGRDATALTVVEVDLSSLADPQLRAPDLPLRAAPSVAGGAPHRPVRRAGGAGGAMAGALAGGGCHRRWGRAGGFPAAGPARTGGAVSVQCCQQKQVGLGFFERGGQRPLAGTSR